MEIILGVFNTGFAINYTSGSSDLIHKITYYKQIVSTKTSPKSSKLLCLQAGSRRHGAGQVPWCTGAADV
jgi:hypothetical protein